jgi:hypothetical protein
MKTCGNTAPIPMQVWVWENIPEGYPWHSLVAVGS